MLEGIESSVDAIIVVDDGSSDGSAEFLHAWRGAPHGVGAFGAGRIGASASTVERPREVITRSANGGKAAALADGFAAALARGFDLALTIDADGQHDPADAASLATVARAMPIESETLLCGVRDPSTPGYPRRNLTGRRLNDLAIRAQTGVQVDDSPCGLRVYPLALVRRVRCLSGRFSWEEEFLTRAIWAGATYRTHAIRCIYAAAGEHRSHYRARRDYPEGIAVNLWLCALALRPPAPTMRGIRRLGRQIGSLASPRRAIAQITGDSPSRLHGAAAMAIGAATLGAVGSGAVSRSEWLTAAIGVWVLLRLHGSLPVALIGAITAALLVKLPVAPPLTALALLLVLSQTALRRRQR